ncbi:cation diffusion facilitator family transporter [Thermoactinomyces sp. CICC 10523]|uniref:cation diffusion facilitator family transporter n=1 Tax=Thermoactinomyces sp. CICC 10523 TaxID=2767428 RepID=UPI00351C6BC8
MNKRMRSPMAVAWVSLVSNILLTLVKFMVGWLYRSPSLVADGAHNAADVVASAATLGSMRVSTMPADREHPYGHGKAEVIASGIVAVILFLAAIWMIYQSIEALFLPPPKAHAISLIAAVFSLLFKLVLYIYTIRIGRKVNSKGLIATAYDHLSDVYSSLAAAIGIGLALLGRQARIPYLEYGDPLASIVVSLLILKVAIHMGREAVDILMERNVAQEKLDQFAAIISAVPGVKRIDRIRAREHGHYILVDVRVGVPGEMTVQEGHDISRAIKKNVMERFDDVQEVLVHINPWYENESAVKANEVDY